MQYLAIYPFFDSTFRFSQFKVKNQPLTVTHNDSHHKNFSLANRRLILGLKLKDCLRYRKQKF